MRVVSHPGGNGRVGAPRAQPRQPAWRYVAGVVVMLGLSGGCGPMSAAADSDDVTSAETGGSSPDLPLDDDLPFLETHCPSITTLEDCRLAHVSASEPWKCIDPETGEPSDCKCVWHKTLEIVDEAQCEGVVRFEGCVPWVYESEDLLCSRVHEVPGGRCREVVVGSDGFFAPTWVSIGWDTCAAPDAPDGTDLEGCIVGGDPPLHCNACVAEIAKAECTE